MKNNSKVLFGISLQLLSIFCLLIAYAEKDGDIIAFAAFIIAIASMIAGLFHTYSAYRES